MAPDALMDGRNGLTHRTSQDMAAELQSLSDEELARQSQAGSLVAFEQLVYRYEGRVHSFAAHLCRNATDAREITQDTFVKAFQSIGQFDSRRVFAPWLFTIARHQSIDRHRAATRFVEAPIPDEADDADPSELTARREEGHNLWRLARERLNDNQFQALWLHYAEDMEAAQIARVLGKTRVHVKVILFRARRILARALNPGRPQAGPAGSATPALAAVATRPSALPPAR
jgi:RNA polymerase sigma-70 factor (ECF subfamily)